MSVRTPPDDPPIPRRVGQAVAADGTSIHFEVSGRGPALVFVHGLGGNHAVWFRQVAHFAGTHTVVTMSQRGFAPSGGNLDRYEVAVVVGDLLAVMDAASVDRAVVIGQSMGGWTALGLALEHPHRAEALALADTLAGIRDDEITKGLRAAGESVSLAPAAPPALGRHPALSEGFSRREPALACLYQSLASFGSPSPASIVGQLLAARAPSERLAALRIPTLFVVGSEDALFPPDLIRRAGSAIHDSEVVVIEDAGHSPYFEQPEAWNRAVGAFLELRRGAAPDQSSR
jgi:3-oxoadipate enol-lactonase